MSWRKYRKVPNVFDSNRTKSKEFINMIMTILQLFLTKKEIIDNARFMANSLSNLADNFVEGIHKTAVIFLNTKA